MNILHIDCSPRPNSHSRQLSADIVERLLAALPEASVSRRDLGREPIPHHDPDYAAVLATPAALAATTPSSGALRLSEQLIREVEASDVIVIGTPMNNFTVPSIQRLGKTSKPLVVSARLRARARHPHHAFEIPSIALNRAAAAPSFSRQKRTDQCSFFIRDINPFAQGCFQKEALNQNQIPQSTFVHER